jgi:hypothetical protein
VSSDPPSLKLRRGREWLTEFLTGDTLFVSWIEQFIDGFFLSPVGSILSVAALKKGGKKPAGEEASSLPIQIVYPASYEKMRHLVKTKHWRTTEVESTSCYKEVLF